MLLKLVSSILMVQLTAPPNILLFRKLLQLLVTALCRGAAEVDLWCSPWGTKVHSHARKSRERASGACGWRRFHDRSQAYASTTQAIHVRQTLACRRRTRVVLAHSKMGSVGQVGGTTGTEPYGLPGILHWVKEEGEAPKAPFAPAIPTTKQHQRLLLLRSTV